MIILKLTPLLVNKGWETTLNWDSLNRDSTVFNATKGDETNAAMKIDNNKQSNCVFKVTFKLCLHGQNDVIYRTDTLNGTVLW